MERVSVDLHVTANSEVGRRDEIHVLVDVLVLSLVEELALDDARVLLSGLVDAEGIIGQVEGDDESPVKILRHASVEPRGKAEDAR